MLSTAAGLDFKQHIILVQARGDRVAALRLWQLVGMVVHFRPGDGFEVPGLPPILHVRAWKNARGLERDDDFASMFLSEAVRGVDPGPQGGVGSFMQASRPGLRCARTWKEGVVLSLPSMWMSTLSFSTELQHRQGLWHH